MPVAIAEYVITLPTMPGMDMFFFIELMLLTGQHFVSGLDARDLARLQHVKARLSLPRLSVIGARLHDFPPFLDSSFSTPFVVITWNDHSPC